METAIVKMDKGGRIHIPKGLKHNLGPRFIITRLGDKLILTSLPVNPIEDLEELGKSIPDKTLKDLRKEILEEAYNDLR
ncbi:AbrB family transcriptional regulator [Cuniculiplasma sp. SKW3]|uniref:AbrB family transcriptional regulator n=1 Tax=unclassified Cuniculiplasma TaxID=2619706 RepID=UPI003FD295C4